MTPEDLIATLRDIQLPEEATPTDPPVLAPEPFLALIALVAVVLSIRWHRRGSWHRDARRRLAASSLASTDSRRWHDLVNLYRWIGAHRRPKNLNSDVFRRPEHITVQQVDDLAAEIRRAIR